MSKLDETKSYVILHAKALGVDKEVALLLRNINTLEDSVHGWGNIFLHAAERAEDKGKINLSLGLYNIARFPYAQTTTQLKAYKKYQDLFKRHYVIKHHFEEKITCNGQQKFYLKRGKSNNLVILCGGIISLKEQWVNAAKIFNSMGFTIILTEMPAVGENSTPYNKIAFNMFSMILDEIGHVPKDDCHLISMSFSGYLALMNSLIDKRIKSITMVGAPIYDLYHDYNTFLSLPEITKNILKNNINRKHNDIELFNYLDNEFPRNIEKNSQLNIFYLQSQFDEIISLKEANYLKSKCGMFNMLCLPDKHGSPNYHKTVVLYIMWSVLQHSKKKRPLRLLLAVITSLSRYIYQIKNQCLMLIK